VFFSQRAPALSVDVQGHSLVAGDWVSATESAGTPLTFSDGSTVLLQRGARARVSSVEPAGARLEITSGRAVVSVIHRAETDYRFSAGPYLVRVTGTRFELGWEEKTQTFFLEMLEGSVLVSGPELKGSQRFITGQRVELAPEAVKTEERDEAEVSVTRKKPPALGPTEDGLAADQRQEEPGQGRRAAPALTWFELAHLGEHSSAIKAAERLGIASIFAQEPGKRLLLLADSASYSGKTGLARRAFRTVRERFPGTNSASEAAFGLGRLNPGKQGVRWFEAYLAEMPSGPLAREALGRILESEAASGSSSRAATVAGRYMARFPTGPHAALARKLIERQK